MDQQLYWNEKWKKVEKIEKETSYAVRCFHKIKGLPLKTVLDLGCGSGRDALFFAKKGYAVTALDFSKTVIDVLLQEKKKQGLHEFTPVVGDITQLSFPKDSFDVIYANLSLQYFDDATTEKIFSQLYGMLSATGYLFVRVKSTDDYYYGKGEKLGENFYLLAHVRHFFSKEFLRKNLNSFEIISLRKVSAMHQPINKEPYKASYLEAVGRKR